MLRGCFARRSSVPSAWAEPPLSAEPPAGARNGRASCSHDAETMQPRPSAEDPPERAGYVKPNCERVDVMRRLLAFALIAVAAFALAGTAAAVARKAAPPGRTALHAGVTAG